MVIYSIDLIFKVQEFNQFFKTFNKKLMIDCLDKKVKQY